MRDFHGTSSVLDSSLSQFFTKQNLNEILFPKEAEVLSRITPNVRWIKVTEMKFDKNLGRSIPTKVDKEYYHPGDTLDHISFGTLKEEDLIFWCCYCWYGTSSVLKSYIRLELQEVIEKRPESFWILNLLYSKSNLLNWLLISDLYHSREFFGNVLNPKESIQRCKSLKFIFESKKDPKRTIRHRGYRDKGTLPSLESRIRKEELRKDVWNTEEQNNIEAERKKLSDTLAFIEGFLSG